MNEVRLEEDVNLTDTHCHLDMIPDEKIALLRAKEAGVGTIINVGTSIDASKQSIAIANSTDLVEIYATCGIHAQEGPKDIKKYGKNFIEELKKTAVSSKKVVGIGECGMDYFEVESAQGIVTLRQAQGKQATSDKEKKEQRELFEAQVQLANELELPLIIHCRNAWEDTFRLLSIDNRQSTLRGLFHSWTGTVEQAKRALSLGFYISISGIVTFKNSGEIPEVAKMIPADRILVETDSPYLSPVPMRGKQNEPKNVKITAQFVAELRGVSLDEISSITTRNARNLFKIANN